MPLGPRKNSKPFKADEVEVVPVYQGMSDEIACWSVYSKDRRELFGSDFPTKGMAERWIARYAQPSA